MRPRAMKPPSRFGDKAFEWLTLAMAMAVVVLVILIGWQLWIGSSLAIKKFGFHFLVTSTWDPVAEQFGALAFHLRNAGFFAHCVAHCGSAGHRHGGLSDRTCATVDSAAARFSDRNAGGHSERDPRALGHFRDDSMAARLPFPIAQTILRLDTIFQRIDLRPVHVRWWNHYRRS